MSDATLYYRHSGGFAPLSLVMMLAVSVLVAAAGGFAYGIIVYYMPLVYLNALACIAVGIGLGTLVRMLAVKLHVRNVPVILLTAVVAGLVAEYAAFVGWIAAVIEWKAVLYSPADVMYALQVAGEEGVWSLSKSDDPVRGWFLYSIWVIEAGIIIIGAALTSVSGMRQLPYCEACGQWLKEADIIGPLEPIPDPTKMRTSLERGDFAVLGEVKSIGPESPANQFAQFELRCCPSCDDTAVMTVRNIQITVDAEGKANATSTNVVENLLIDRASSELIRQLTPQPGGAEAAPAAAENPPQQQG